MKCHFGDFKGSLEYCGDQLKADVFVQIKVSLKAKKSYLASYKQF